MLEFDAATRLDRHVISHQHLSLPQRLRPARSMVGSTDLGLKADSDLVA